MGVDAPNHPHPADTRAAADHEQGHGTGNGAPPAEHETGRRRRWSNRIPLLIVLVLTLLGVAGVLYDSFAPTTQEPLDARAHSAVQHACDTAYRALKALPPLTHDSTRAELAARTTQENSIFTTMVSQFGRV